MNDIKVSIMMGSKNDWSVLESAGKLLDEFGVAHEARVLSAHRTPKDTVEYVEALKSRGAKVVIAGAGGSAALAGVVAAHTTLPVIGVPVDSMGLGGLDALLSTVQMPPGVPVGGVAIGKAGAKNAALLAVRILGIADEGLVKKLEAYREEERQKILKTKIKD
jgi:5-(carboxyamino)imidazole ribonucleotide mutase